MSWNYVNLFELFLCDTGSGERKICSQTRGLKLCKPFWTVKSGKRVWEKKNTLPDSPKEENRVWRCENKQPDPGNKNYVNHFGQSNPETGSEERKIRSQTRSRKKNGFGEKKIYSQTCEAQDSIRFPSPPVSSPLAFRHPT